MKTRGDLMPPLLRSLAFLGVAGALLAPRAPRGARRVAARRAVTAEADSPGVPSWEALSVQAWRAQLEYDRKQEAKARKRAEEERKRRKEEERLRKLMLDAAKARSHHDNSLLCVPSAKSLPLFEMQKTPL